MKTIKYKTIRGLLSQSGQMTIEYFFRNTFYHMSRREFCGFSIDDSQKRQVAEKFAEYLLSSKKRRADLVDALMNERGDLGYFQCFYINYDKKRGLYISNSLSGEALNHCKRVYLKRYC